METHSVAAVAAKEEEALAVGGESFTSLHLEGW
jgi:hypothetical protein